MLWGLKTASSSGTDGHELLPLVTIPRRVGEINCAKWRTPNRSVAATSGVWTTTG